MFALLRRQRRPNDERVRFLIRKHLSTVYLFESRLQSLSRTISRGQSDGIFIRLDLFRHRRTLYRVADSNEILRNGRILFRLGDFVAFGSRIRYPALFLRKMATEKRDGINSV